MEQFQRLRLIFLCTLSLYALSACQQLTYTTTGQNTTASVNLNISPENTTLSTNEEYPFITTKGFPAYTYSVDSGGGTINPTTGVFTAPFFAGASTLQVTDLNSDYGYAVVTTVAFAPMASPFDTTLAKFQINSGAVAQGAATDAAGNVYVAGYALDVTNIKHWIVQMWNGATWTILDDITDSGDGSNSGAAASGILISGVNIYVVGLAQDASHFQHWMVRQYNGVAWVTVDNSVTDSGDGSNAGAQANGVTMDGLGNIYVVGTALDVTTKPHWLTRESVTGVWSTIDVVNDSGDASNSGARGSGLTVSGANVYAVGTGVDSSAINHWLTRQWNGTTWTTIDTISDIGDASNLGAQASAITTDGSGDLYVVGNAKGTGINNTWMTRYFNGVTWTTTDNTLSDSGDGSNQGAFANGVTFVSAATVYVSGYAFDATGLSHWMIRQWNGTTWATVDNVKDDGDGFINGAAAYAITSFGTNIYAVGYGAASPASNTRWMVRDFTTGPGFSNLNLYNYNFFTNASIAGVAIDPTGNAYVTGQGEVSETRENDWITRKWNGVAWSPSDDFSYVLNSIQSSSANAITALGVNDIVAVGQATDLSGFNHWVTRQYNGVSWGTVDDLDDAGDASNAGANAMATSGSSAVDLYVVGEATDISAVKHWFTRYFNGAVWGTSDNITDSGDGSNKGATAFGATDLSPNNVYVVGQGTDASSFNHWLTRFYNGSTWTTVDSFTDSGDSSNAGAQANAAAFDGNGNVYVAGYANSAGPISNWMVREWNGTSWITLDSVADSGDGSNSGAQATGITVDPNNNVYISGWGKDISSQIHPMIRKWNGFYMSTVDSITGNTGTVSIGASPSSAPGPVFSCETITTGLNTLWSVRLQP